MSPEPETSERGDDPSSAQRYLAKVMAEIDEEVDRRRTSGDLPLRLEHELDELFLRFSPMASRFGGLEEAIGSVEASAYIDPVVPVASSRSGGTLVKRSIRQASMWYVGWVTAQVNQFTAAATRTLRVLDDRVRALQRQLEAQQVPAAPVLETAWAHGPGAWWVDTALRGLSGSGGRVLHAAAADGWLVRRLVTEGVDAYGVEPRDGRIDLAEVEGLDLRQEPVLEHLRAVGTGGLAGLVLTGVVDVMTAGERSVLIELATRAVGPGGRLVVHSLSEAGWRSEDAPIEADAAAGRPLRPRTWTALLERDGFKVAVLEGPEGLDYLVVATAAEGGTEAAEVR